MRELTTPAPGARCDRWVQVLLSYPVPLKGSQTGRRAHARATEAPRGRRLRALDCPPSAVSPSIDVSCEEVAVTNALVRLVRALPLVVVLAVVAVLVYCLVASFRTPDRAKEVLIRLFAALNGALTALFCLASAYAISEANEPVFELASAFAAVTALAFAVTMACRWLFLRRRPGYPWRRVRRIFRRR